MSHVPQVTHEQALNRLAASYPLQVQLAVAQIQIELMAERLNELDPLEGDEEDG